jgi:hypothetical protein
VAPPESRRPKLTLVAQIAGLLATGWIVWSFSVAPRLGRLPLGFIIGQAFLRAFVAAAGAAAMTIGLYLIATRTVRSDGIRMALRTSATAVWFAPAAILLSEMSPVAFGAAIVLLISATRLLYSQWRLLHPTPDTLPECTGLFETEAPPLRLRDLFPGLSTALALQATVAAVLLRYSLVAAVMLCWSVAMLTLLSVMGGAADPRPPRSLPRSILGVVLTVILAAGLTVGGMAGHIQSPWWMDGDSLPSHPKSLVETAKALIDRLLHPKDTTQPRGSVTKLYAPPTGNAVEVTDKSFPGVILWPERELPRLHMTPSFNAGAITLEQNAPMRIEFAGVYWMFRPPNLRPPETSYSRKGNPLTLSFMTTDRIPMRMEAHQKLEHPIDLRCCSAIQMDISNRDRYPGTVSLEVVLIDSALDRRQSLGSAEVTSRPHGEPVPETLTFPVPSAAAIREFNEISVVFQRAQLRIDRSARISIERFSLIPR